MGKINFESIEKSYIINFIKSNYRVVNDGWITTSMGMNLVATVGAVYFAANRILSIIWCVVFCGVLLYSFSYYRKHYRYNKRKMNLFNSVYVGLWFVSMGILSYLLFRYGTQDSCLGYLIFLIICGAGTMVLSLRSFAKKIQRDYFKGVNKPFALGTGVMMAGILLMRPLQELINPMVYMGILCGILAVSSLPNMNYFALKYYCYSLIDEKEIEPIKKTLKQKRRTFDGYGKK